MEEEKKAIVSSSLQKRNKLVFATSSSLPHDAIENIFLRLPVKTLIRLKSLSKKWRSTIESRCFSHRHLKFAEKSHVDHPKIMIITQKWDPDIEISFRTICLEAVCFRSSPIFNFPQGFHRSIHASESCDGLFCIHSPEVQSIYVVNPATRWLRQLPPARFQILMHKINPSVETWKDMRPVCHLAFVKATGYKLVWLYNSDTYNSNDSSPNEGVTKCEVFDFEANAWRYLTCTPSYRIYHDQKPASANGSLYWFTEPYNAEIKVIAFDIHTEAFRLLPKPSSAIINSDPGHIDLCTVDNSLCMYEREGNKIFQEIWRLKSSEDAWEKIYTINLLSDSYTHFHFYEGFNRTLEGLAEPSTPVAIYKNKKILLSHSYTRNLVNPETESLCSYFQQFLSIRSVPYIPSLISHI